MKKTILVLVMAAVLAVSAATVANAGGTSGPQLTEVRILDGFQHLGDANPSWETTIRLRSGNLTTATSAHVELYLAGSEEFMNSIVINGRSFALPDTDEVTVAETELYPKLLLSIPIGLLHAGANTIGFEAGPIPVEGNTNDDFDFGEATLLLSG